MNKIPFSDDILQETMVDVIVDGAKFIQDVGMIEAMKYMFAAYSVFGYQYPAKGSLTLEFIERLVSEKHIIIGETVELCTIVPSTTTNISDVLPPIVSQVNYFTSKPANLGI
jgi:hypothetical protein